MELKAEKKPIWGIPEYLHFVVLGLSALNLIQLLPNLFSYFNQMEFWSILLSLGGLLSFFLVHKKKKGGNLIILIWSILQLVIYSNSPFMLFDFSQGISFPFGMTFESSTNGFITKQVSLQINILAILFISAAFYRLKNSFEKLQLNISTANITQLTDFTAKIIKTYSFGQDKKVFILDNTAEKKSYAIQIKENDKADFPHPETDYLLFEIDSIHTKKESFKSHDCTQLGYVRITISEK